MDFKPTESDFREFLALYARRPIMANDGGMKAPDMFTLFWTCRTLKPNVVVESGVWRGQSTWLIREVCGANATIICLDPRQNTHGWVDASPRTTYLMGPSFVDFGSLSIEGGNTPGVLCFFDDHQDAWLRVEQCTRFGIKNVLFNDNYPPGCGAHRTLAHCDPEQVRAACQSYLVFPNIVGTSVQTGNGPFACESVFAPDALPPDLALFAAESDAYRWNTFVELR
jgi:hypothetical protein